MPTPIRTRLEHLARQHGIEPDEAFWRMTLVGFATLVLERQEEDAPVQTRAESLAEIEGEDRADRKR